MVTCSVYCLNLLLRCLHPVHRWGGGNGGFVWRRMPGRGKPGVLSQSLHLMMMSLSMFIFVDLGFTFRLACVAVLGVLEPSGHTTLFANGELPFVTAVAALAGG